MSPTRSYERAAGDIRPVEIEPGFVRTADGSALYSQGETRVICTASVQHSVPRWMEGSGRGWVTAEYAMLPASTGSRKERDSRKGRQDGRGVEIQRLIGRSLRAIVDFEALGERSIYVDCDVLQADGGTRCASITGGFVALRLATRKLIDEGLVTKDPLAGSVAAISCGLVDGEALCDLDYSEDSRAEVDANVVMSRRGRPGRGPGHRRADARVSRTSLDDLLALAEPALAELRDAQARGMRLTLATRNEHKLRELAEILAGVELVPLPDGRRAPAGDGRDLRRQRADQGARRARGHRRRRRSPTTPGSRRAASAARPGVRSARYAGEHATDEENLELLLREVAARATIAGSRTSARSPTSTRRAPSASTGGAARESSPTEPRGDGGFGYDPAFVPDDTGTRRRPDDGRARPATRSTPSATAAGRRASSPPRSASSPMTRTKTGAAWVSIASNSILVAIKLAAGAITGSIAIVTEAAHSAIDLVASIIALASIRAAEEPPDPEHPYGHERFEQLGAAIEGMLIVVGAGHHRLRGDAQARRRRLGRPPRASASR